MMQPLEDLLHRIKWDRGFGTGDFALGYYDRVRDAEEIVPFASVTIDTDRSGTFTFTDADGAAHHVPLHRVRTVYRNGVAIWKRPGKSASHGRARDGRQ